MTPYSEDRAQTKWCPFTGDGGRGVLGPTLLHIDGKAESAYVPYGHCIGRKCAAWRWAVSPEDVQVSAAVEPEARSCVQALGFCGLATRTER